MATRTDEQTVNAALGEALGRLRRGWDVLADRRGPVLLGGGWPDVLVREPAGWPVAVEAKHHPNHAGAEASASARLGRQPASGPHPIETAIALVYPPQFASLDGAPLRAAIDTTDALEYALYSQGEDGAPPDRLPASGWLRGSVRDLAMLVQRAAVPARRVDALAERLERGVEEAAEASSERHEYGSARGKALAGVLEQHDDPKGQTRRMAMTVIVNALIFHASLAEADFEVGAAGARRPVRPVTAFVRTGGAFDRPALLDEWDGILARNYHPIFASAKELLDPARDNGLPETTAQAVLRPLWDVALDLVNGGVTRSHDLTGVVFQRLIADRKFLATYYTRPAAAALLAGLALPADRAPGGADWGDAETLASLQIGDFACGTGTLLSAAYSRLGLLHELHGGDPEALHALIGQAAAVTAGGRAPEDVDDLVSRIGHGQFDLVIMNPPFTRATTHEGGNIGTGNPAFAAMETPRETQRDMLQRLNEAAGNTGIGSARAGLASHFVDLAFRKARAGGTIAFVLPLSMVAGTLWQKVRTALAEGFPHLVVATIAGAGSRDSSFSADTGMAECLLIGRKSASAGTS